MISAPISLSSDAPKGAATTVALISILIPDSGPYVGIKNGAGFFSRFFHLPMTLLLYVLATYVDLLCRSSKLETYDYDACCAASCKPNCLALAVVAAILFLSIWRAIMEKAMPTTHRMLPMRKAFE